MRLGRSTPEALDNQRIVHVNGHDYVLSEFVGAAPVRGMYVEGNEANGNELPQGFLVEQPPGSVTPPHFHETDQFQVFVGGSGQMGKRTAQPVAVHYAGGHTPYGPIAAGDDGVQYFTLRRHWDPGAKYMPQSRDRLRRGPRRHRLSDSISLTNGGRDRSGGTSVALRTIMPLEEDGLAAYLLRLGANEAADAPDPAGGGGQYHVVVGGSMVDGDQTLPRLSCHFVTADEAAARVTAGPDGLDLLVLQFPRA